MKPDKDEVALLIQKLRWLRLPGMAGLVSEILDEAAKKNLTVLEVVLGLTRSGGHRRKGSYGVDHDHRDQDREAS